VRIHDVFHIAFLKKYTGVEPAKIPPLPLIVRGRAVLQPYQVVHARPTTTSWDLLVKWKNSSPADVSWEQLKAFKEAYPDFQLEDKLFEPEGDDVMDSYLGKQHSRRRKTSGGSHSG
jgi:hypothetical protein